MALYEEYFLVNAKLQDMDRLLWNGDLDDLADATLVVNGMKSIRAHKFVLSTCSPFFSELIRMEPTSSDTQLKLYLHTISSKILKKGLTLMYGGQVKVESEEKESFLEMLKIFELNVTNDYQYKEQSVTRKLTREESRKRKGSKPTTNSTLIKRRISNGMCLDTEAGLSRSLHGEQIILDEQTDFDDDEGTNSDEISVTDDKSVIQITFPYNSIIDDDIMTGVIEHPLEHLEGVELRHTSQQQLNGKEEITDPKVIQSGPSKSIVDREAGSPGYGKQKISNKSDITMETDLENMSLIDDNARIINVGTNISDDSSVIQATAFEPTNSDINVNIEIDDIQKQAGWRESVYTRKQKLICGNRFSYDKHIEQLVVRWHCYKRPSGCMAYTVTYEGADKEKRRKYEHESLQHNHT